MKIFTDKQLCNSETLKQLSVLSRVNPINVNDQAEVHSALAGSLIYLITAHDNGAIEFQDREDRNAFLLMLLAVHQIVNQIKPLSNTKH